MSKDASLDQNPVLGSLHRKLNIGISSCLLGQEVRFNGGHTQSRFCTDVLSAYCDFVAFCPEVAAGFPTPRPAMRLVGDLQQPRLEFSKDGSEDLSPQLKAGYADKLADVSALDGYILMKNSPSCGMMRVKVYRDNGHPFETQGAGMFAADLMAQHPLLPVEEEGRLNDKQLLENFILRVFAYRRFKDEVLACPSVQALTHFHSSYKYVLLAHHQQLSRDLGRMIGEQHGLTIEALCQAYISDFMRALAKPATKANHANALQHIAGHISDDISSAARQDIAKVIDDYRTGSLPLNTPITLLRHYIQQHGSAFISQQRYLSPYPDALGLANPL